MNVQPGAKPALIVVKLQESRYLFVPAMQVQRFKAQVRKLASFYTISGPYADGTFNVTFEANGKTPDELAGMLEQVWLKHVVERQWRVL